MQYADVMARALPGAYTYRVWYTLYLTEQEAEACNYQIRFAEIGEMLTAGDGCRYRVCGRATRSHNLMMHPNGGYFTNCYVLGERVGAVNLVPIGLAGRSLRIRRGGHGL